MTTRKEAAAEAICEWDNQYNWGGLGDESPMKALYEDAATLALTASDAVILSDATVERAARALYEAYPLALYDEDAEQFVNGGRPWEWLTEEFKQSKRAQARAVLAAAVEAEQ